jgi:dipeptidase D
VINLDGTGLTNLTNDPADDWAPTWSPDGTLIAFQSNRDGNWEIYTMAAAPLEGGTGGSGATNLTNDPADDQMPYWRPAAQAAGSSTAVAAAAAGRVPLVDAIADMEPHNVWQNFYDLTQIPRPSHHEEQVRDFLAAFGKNLGLETIVDGVGNVIIRKPAAAGMEKRTGVILQGHMDMVPQKTPDTVHDFATDPIEAYVEGGWVRADGTTLGADDGIGVAMAMAVLQSDSPPLGPIEALFTVNEEDGMDGANGLQPGVLSGDILINLDEETEGKLTISSAGGENAEIQGAHKEQPVPKGMVAYQVTVQGLTGGHSGVDIDKGRGHATKLLVRLLHGAATAYGVRIAELSGGTANNAIPRDATALVCLPKAQADDFLAYVAAFEATVKSELAAVEPELSVQADPADLPRNVMAEGAQERILDALYGTPQGVIRMSDTVPGLVETSTNMGIVQVADGKLAVMCLSRSSVDTELDDIGAMVSSVWELAGAQVELTGRYPGWPANPDSAILGLMKAVYQELYGQEPQVAAVHAGLEPSVIGGTYPNLDMISIGPTLVDVHTPDERMEIATVQKVYDLLLATLQQIPEK